MEVPEDIGRIVRFHRKKSGLTQARLAELAGVGKTVVFDIENGKPSIRMNTLSKVLSILNVRLVPESPLMAEMQEEDRKEGEGKE